MDIAECFRRSRDGLMLLSGLLKIDLTGAIDSLVSEVGVLFILPSRFSTFSRSKQSQAPRESLTISPSTRSIPT